MKPVGPAVTKLGMTKLGVSGLAAAVIWLLGKPLWAPAAVPQPPLAAEQAALAAALPALPALPVAAALGRSRPVFLHAPEVGRADNVVDLGLDSDGALQVARGGQAVGWYAGGAAPGEPGPAVLVGHVTWNGRPAVFYPLGRLRPGQLVAVGRADGRVMTFRVRTVESHPKHAFPTKRVYGPTQGPQLRLVTCGGSWNGRTHADNIIVFADLVETSTAETPEGGDNR